jgi:soluble lytic murein transglycosylase-like protein
MNKIKFLILSIFVLIVILALSSAGNQPKDTTVISIDNIGKFTSNDPPCLQMFNFIEKYADSFNIPKQYAYGIAYNETRYNGPFHWRYNHAQTSSANAVGPMQVKPSTASYINKEHVFTHKLKYNIEYNIMTSMKLLRRLKNKYKDWGRVFGAYNTGSPIINDYAKRVLNHKINWK